MPVIISDELVLSQVQDFDPDNPIIGWVNYVTPSLTSAVFANNPTVDASDVDFPAANMAADTTDTRWEAPDSVVFEDIDLIFQFDGLRPIDYLAFAVHNLGTNQRALRVFGATTSVGGNPVYTALAQEVILADDSPVLFRFAEANYTHIKLALKSSYIDTEDPYVSVVFVGKLLVIERKIQVAFTPINYGRRPRIQNARSENGKFLGRTVLSEWRESTASIAYLSSDWYRDELDEFVAASQTETFFFAWAPISYPLEIGYAWMTNEPAPEIFQSLEDGGHIIRIGFEMQGVV